MAEIHICDSELTVQKPEDTELAILMQSTFILQDDLFKEVG